MYALPLKVLYCTCLFQFGYLISVPGYKGIKVHYEGLIWLEPLQDNLPNGWKELNNLQATIDNWHGPSKGKTCFRTQLIPILDASSDMTWSYYKVIIGCLFIYNTDIVNVCTKYGIIRKKTFHPFTWHITRRHFPIKILVLWYSLKFKMIDVWITGVIKFILAIVLAIN